MDDRLPDQRRLSDASSLLFIYFDDFWIFVLTSSIQRFPLHENKI